MKVGRASQAVKYLKLSVTTHKKISGGVSQLTIELTLWRVDMVQKNIICKLSKLLDVHLVCGFQ